MVHTDHLDQDAEELPPLIPIQVHVQHGTEQRGGVMGGVMGGVIEVGRERENLNHELTGWSREGIEPHVFKFHRKTGQRRKIWSIYGISKLHIFHLQYSAVRLTIRP